MKKTSKPAKTFNTSRGKSYLRYRHRKNRTLHFRKGITIDPNNLFESHEKVENRNWFGAADTNTLYKNEDREKINYDMVTDNYELYCKLYTLMVFQRSKGDRFMNVAQRM